MKNTEIEYWECTYCKRKISHGVYERIEHDVDCRCNNCTVSEYRAKYKKREKNETRDQ